MPHRDVVATIAPGNLAAFPPSLEVNAGIAGANTCPCRRSLHSGFEQKLETYV